MSTLVKGPATLAELAASLGDISAKRVLVNRRPALPQKRICLAIWIGADKRLVELVDGVLVEKAMGWKESLGWPSSTARARPVVWSRVYPSPAGPLESQVEPDAWAALARDNTVLRELEPDVEALLVNRVRGAREHYRCSIDRCYHLIGIVRAHWRGFSGGPDLWARGRNVLARLRAEAEM